MPQLATLLEKTDLSLIVWPTDTLVAITTKRTIDQEYQRLGGPGGVLGAPIGGVQPGANGGQFQNYEHGAIYWRQDLGAHGLYGDIAKKYLELNAEHGFLGYPTTS